MKKKRKRRTKWRKSCRKLKSRTTSRKRTRKAKKGRRKTKTGEVVLGLVPAVDPNDLVLAHVRAPVPSGLDRCPAVGPVRAAVRAARAAEVVRSPAVAVAALPALDPVLGLVPAPVLAADQRLVPVPDRDRVRSRPDPIDPAPGREVDRVRQLPVGEDRAAAQAVAPAVSNAPEVDPSEDDHAAAGQLAKQLIVSLICLNVTCIMIR